MRTEINEGKTDKYISAMPLQGFSTSVFVAYFIGRLSERLRTEAHCATTTTTTTAVSGGTPCPF